MVTRSCTRFVITWRQGRKLVESDLNHSPEIVNESSVEFTETFVDVNLVKVRFDQIINDLPDKLGWQLHIRGPVQRCVGRNYLLPCFRGEDRGSSSPF